MDDPNFGHCEVVGGVPQRGVMDSYLHAIGRHPGPGHVVGACNVAGVAGFEGPGRCVSRGGHGVCVFGGQTDGASGERVPSIEGCGKDAFGTCCGVYPPPPL